MSSMSKRKLLLADDSITIQKVVNLTFADEGIEVISVGDGDSAMRKFDDFIPDLVMADVNMPGLNGYEMCQIIKNNEETQTIPVILLVGSFEPFDEAEADRVGADGYLTKPFQSIRQLVNKVTDLLNKTENGTIQPSPEERLSEEPSEPESDSFAETMEMPLEKIQTDFGDAGMDDEMIETSRADYYESPSRADYQTGAETPEDYAQTQPLAADEPEAFDFPESRESVGQETRAEDSFSREEVQSETPSEAFFQEEAPRDEFSAETAPAEEETSEIAAERESLDEESLREESAFGEEAGEEPETTAESRPEAVSAPEPFYHSSEDESLQTQDSQYQSHAPEDESQAPQAEALTAEQTVQEPAPEQTAEMTEEVEASPVAFDEQVTAAQPAGETETAPETQIEETHESVEELPQSRIQTAEKIPVLGFEDDLLELPPLVEETGIRPPPKTEPEPVAVQPPPPPPPAPTIPPEVIEAIAQRVAEKISGQAIREIASQIVPQVSEMIAEELAKEQEGNK